MQPLTMVHNNGIQSIYMNIAKAQKTIDSFTVAYLKSNTLKGIPDLSNEYYEDNHINLDSHAHIKDVDDIAFARFFPAKKQNKTRDIEKVMKDFFVQIKPLLYVSEIFFSKILEKTLLYTNLFVNFLVRFDIACEKYIYEIYDYLIGVGVGKQNLENKFDNISTRKILTKKKINIENKNEFSEYKIIPVRVFTQKKLEKINKNINIKEKTAFTEVLSIIYHELRYGGKINW